MSDLDLHVGLLAQDGSAGLPGETTSVSGAPVTGEPAPVGGPPTGFFGGNFMFLVLGMLVLMIIISSIAPRREKKKREAMISGIKKNDRVQTVGGVRGSIVELKPDEVVLKVDENANTKITFAKSAIQQVLSQSDDRS